MLLNNQEYMYTTFKRKPMVTCWFENFEMNFDCNCLQLIYIQCNVQMYMFCSHSVEELTIFTCIHKFAGSCHCSLSRSRNPSHYSAAMAKKKYQCMWWKEERGIHWPVEGDVILVGHGVEVHT